MKFIKSILALAAAVFIGSSAWASTTTFNGQTITYTGTASVSGDGTTSRIIKWTTGTGTLVVPANATADILVVGGGASGGTGDSDTSTANRKQGNGGNAGKVTSKTSQSLTASTTYNITVGAGGTRKKVSSSKANGNAGSQSSFSGNGLTAITAAGGTANTITDDEKDHLYDGAGASGNGKNGVPNSITGSSVTYGTGGSYAAKTSTQPSAATANTGNGGGGCGNGTSYYSAAGGSGVVIVKITAMKVTEKQASSVSTTTAVATTNVQLEAGSAFSKSVSWNGTAESGDSGIATATVASGATTRPTMTITPKGAGTTTLTVKNSSDTDKYDFTWTVTVTVTKAPKVYDYKGYKIAALGAEQVVVEGDDLVLRFTESGTMNVPVDLIANVLVVGGGGSGAAGRSGSSHTYCGNGGGGGKGSLSSETLDAGDYVITVGNGGKGLKNEDSWQGETYKNGNPGDYSSIIGGREFPGLQADGGTAGSGGAEGSAADGTGGYNTELDITGDPVLYGANGKGASQDTAQPGVNGGGGQGSYNGKTSADGGSGVVIVRFTGVVKQRDPIAVPTAAQNLVYGYTNQIGVAEGEGYVLTGVSVTNEVGNYVAIATPDEDHCWIGGSIESTNIAWSIARAQATVTVVSTNKLVGAEDPEYQTTTTGFIAEDPTELTWTAFRTNTSETVGTYDVLVAGEEFQGGYQISYNKGTLEIRAGKMTVNGKGYDNITDAFQDLLQNKGSATFNDTGIGYDGMTFQRGSTLTVADDESWTVTNNGGTSLIATKIPGKMNLTVDGTLELSGDIFVAPMGEDDTIVTVTNFLLDASITVGKESNGATDAMAVLAFEEINVGEYKLTLTTNGVVQSLNETQLVIADVFADAPTGFRITEAQIDGGFEYTLEALNVVEVPTAVDGFVYNGNEQTGVVENVGFTLTGNFATNADDYTAVATLADGYIWADGSSDPTNINWSIGKFAITVTPVATNKLVGAEDPELTYTTDEDLFKGDKFTGKLARSEGEDVGTYNITQGTLAIDDGNEGANYELTFDTDEGEDAFEIKAGVINVNGKGYATVEEAFAALVLAAKSGTATATFNEEVEAQGYKFAQGAVLTIEEGGVWTVTGDVTVPMVEKEKKVTVSDGTLTLAGDIFVGDRADVTTEVVATNVVLAANVTVGAATEGFDTVGIAVLAFDEIDVGDYKLTLTTNGVVQSAKALKIEDVFEDAPTGFRITETQIDGGYEYKLAALNVVEVPTAVDGLVYNGNEQTGVVEGEGYTLEDNTATDAGSYTATATLLDGYIWADGSSDPTNINWTIAAKPVEVTADDQTMLVGGEMPELTYEITDGELVEGDVLVGTLTVEDELTVGTHDIVQADDWENPNYAVTFVKGTLTVGAGKITVNGKGYDTVAEAYIALVDAAKSGKATAVFNEAVANFNGYSFAKGGTLTVEEGGRWTVTGDVTAAMIEKEKTVTVVDSTLTLGGDIYVGDRADWPTEVTSSNVVLAANVTVGAATEGFKPVGIATLAFEEINVNGHKLTLTTNGVVQSVAQLTIDDVFAKVDHFGVVEKAITGGYEYTLEATEFSVNYYDGDAVVHTDKATILNYTTDLHIWNGVREGYEFGGYTREDGVTPLLVSDEALRAYVKEEAEKPGCDGEVKVFGTWTEIPKTFDITIEAGEGITNVTMNGESVIGKVTLDAGTTEIALTLMSTNTIPVFKFSKDGGANWAVTNKTPVIAVAANDALKFVSEEAKINDPTVTPEQAKSAIIDAIDDENKEAVAPKVEAVVDTAETPAPGKVSAKDMATWITDKRIKSVDMKDSNYLAASVNLDTSAPITDAAEVKFVEVEEDTSTGFTFDFELKLSGEETPEELEVEAAKLAGYIQTTGDLGKGFDGKTVGTDRVTIDPDTGKVTITPDPAKSAEFFKIVIPQDPGVE